MALVLVRELGMMYQTPQSKVKRRLAVYRCSGCDEEGIRQMAVVKAGYTNWCVACGIEKQRSKK